MKKCFYVFIILSIFSLIVSFVSAEKIDRIAAIVNGDVITEEELDLFEKMEPIEAGSPVSDKKNLLEVRKELLERMIEDRLILQEAKKTPFKMNEDMVEERVRDIKFRAGGELAFEKALKGQGLSLTEVREKLKNQFLIYAIVQREVKSKVRVSPKDVTEYYQQHKNEFMTPETAVVDSIFVKDKEQLALCEKALKEGRDFSEVAKEFSQKQSLDAVGRGQFKKDLEDFIFNLKIGVASKPFATEDGFYIFLVKEKLPPSEKSLTEERQAITTKVEEEKTARLLKEWLERLKDNAYISIRE